MTPVEAMARAIAIAQGLDPDVAGVIGEAQRLRVTGQVFSQGVVGPLWNLIAPEAARLVEILGEMNFLVHQGPKKHRRRLSH